MNYEDNSGSTPAVLYKEAGVASRKSSVTEQVILQINASLDYLTQAVTRTDETFGGVLRSPVPADKSKGEIREVDQSPMHGSLLAIQRRIDEQLHRLGDINDRSTL